MVCTADAFRPHSRHTVRWLDKDTDYTTARPFRPADAPLTRPDREAAHADGYSCCAAFDQGRAVSIAAVWRCSDGTWEVAAVHTLPDCRRRGHARSVVSHATRHILDSGRVATCTTDDDNAAMIATAESVGFTHRPAPRGKGA